MGWTREWGRHMFSQFISNKHLVMAKAHNQMMSFAAAFLGVIRTVLIKLWLSRVTRFSASMNIACNDFLISFQNYSNRKRNEWREKCAKDRKREKNGRENIRIHTSGTSNYSLWIFCMFMCSILPSSTSTSIASIFLLLLLHHASTKQLPFTFFDAILIGLLLFFHWWHRFILFLRSRHFLMASHY